jgi:hypothetical protein
MSMVRELVAAVIAAERNLDEQMTRLHSYSKKNEDIMRAIQTELEGSGHPSATQMTAQLEATQKEIKNTLAMLEESKQKLQRVRML